MLRKDYIVRQLEEFGKVMAVILNLKKDHNWDKFEYEINSAVLKFTQLEITQLENIDTLNFKKEVILNSNLSHDQLLILADLLYEKMNFYAEIEQEEKYNNLKQKCLTLYKYLQTNFTENEFNMNVYYKLEILKTNS